MAKRTWTYEDITANAEAGITISMNMARSAHAKNDKDSAANFASFAWGRFCAWDSITTGWQEPGDAERLEALTEVHRG